MKINIKSYECASRLPKLHSRVLYMELNSRELSRFDVIYFIRNLYKAKKYIIYIVILIQNSELFLVPRNIFLKQSQKYVFISEIWYHIKLILQILKFYNDFSRSNENSKIYRFLPIGAKMEFTISSDKEGKKGF